MKKNLIYIFIVAMVLAQPAFGRELSTNYYFSLKKDSSTASETIYAFEFVNINGRAVNIPERFLTALENRLDSFIKNDIEIEDGLFTMSVEKKEWLKVGIRFRSKIDKATLMFSCFQAWYLSLSTVEQLNLRADLNNHTSAEARARLEIMNGEYIDFFTRNMSSCMTSNTDVIDSDTGVFLYIGFSDWYNGTATGEYRNFQSLLDGSKEQFNVNNAVANASEYLREWLTQVRADFEKNDWQSIDDIIEKTPAEDYRNRTRLTLNYLKELAAFEDISQFFEEDIISPALANDLQTIEMLLDACYPETDYLCAEDIDSRFVQITFRSALLDDFDTFLSAKGM